MIRVRLCDGSIRECEPVKDVPNNGRGCRAIVVINGVRLKVKRRVEDAVFRIEGPDETPLRWRRVRDLENP